MEQRTLDWLDLLARVLLWGALGMALGGVIGAITILGSEDTLPFLDEFQRQNRGTYASFALGGGLAAAGVLAGLGGILRILVADWRERHAKKS